MTQSNDPSTIEAEIERDRASLASTLDALSGRVSVDHIAHEALGLLKSNAQGTIDRAMRANPLALALTGAGIAWLLLGSRNRPTPDPEPERLSQWEDEGGLPSPDPVEWDRSDWSRSADRLRTKASASLKRIETDAASYAAGVAGGVADRVASVSDFAAERAAVATDFAASLAETFKHGLDDLGEAARERIIAARERAYAARIRGQAAARNATHEAGRMIEDHPLVAASIAAALGATLAAMLPRTRTEDEVFGAESDRLMDEAARLLREERAKAVKVAEGIGSDIKTAVKDTVDTAADAATKVGKNARSRATEVLDG